MKLAEQLDGWTVERNLEARIDGMLALPACTIHLLGQGALIEVGLALRLPAN